MFANDNNAEGVVSQEILVETLEAWKERASLLERALKERETELSTAREGEALWKRSSEGWAERFNKARTLFEASLTEDGVDTDNLGYSTGRLVELFEIEFTEEVEVTFTVTYSGTVTVPKGADLGDLVAEDGNFEYAVNVELNGDTVGSLTHDNEEFDY